MKPDQSPISAALADGSKTFMALAVVSGFINILMLTGSVFMIQIYDRVLVSRSLPTLIAFSAMAVAAYLFQGVPDIIRARVLALIGEAVDAKIGTQLYKAVAELPLRSDRPGQESATCSPTMRNAAPKSFARWECGQLWPSAGVRCRSVIL